jgi:galactokinase
MLISEYSTAQAHCALMNMTLIQQHSQAFWFSCPAPEFNKDATRCKPTCTLLWSLKKTRTSLVDFENAPCMLQILALKDEDEELTQKYKARSAQVADAVNKLGAIQKANILICAQLRELKTQTAKEDVRIQCAR